MKKRTILRNVILIGCMLIAVILLYSQVKRTDIINNYQPPFQQVEMNDSVPPIDNSEGMAELDKIIKRYESGNLHVAGEIRYFANSDSLKVPQERSNFVLTSISDGSYSYEIDSILTIAQNDLTIIVDKREKNIVVNETIEETNTVSTKTDFITDIKIFKQFISSIQKTSKEGKSILSILFKEDAPISANSYAIEYDAESFRIFKVRIWITDAEISQSGEGQNEEDELVLTDDKNNETATGFYAANVKENVYEIVYKVERLADKSNLTISNYVKKENGGFVPVGVYKNYELLN